MDIKQIMKVADPENDLTAGEVATELGIKTKLTTLVDYDIKVENTSEIQQLKKDLEAGEFKHYTTDQLASFAKQMGHPVDNVLQHWHKHWVRMRLVQMLRLTLLKTKSKKAIGDEKLFQVAEILNIPIPEGKFDRKKLITDIKWKIQ